MEIEEGIRELRKISIEHMGDNEIIHIRADRVLLDFVPKEIREKYEEISRSVRFWYT